MNDSNFNFWQRWLTYANGIIIGVGLIVAFGGGNSLFFDMHNDYTRKVFFNNLPFSIEVLQFKNWLFGIIGGTIVGFHVLMLMISEHAFKRKETWAYHALWYGLLSWFLIDSSISFYFGALYNIVLINLVALVLIGLPLIMTGKAFMGKSK